jgi:hypothetical protein
VDPRGGLDDMEKRKFLTLPGLNSDPSVVQPVASRYTDYATTDTHRKPITSITAVLLAFVTYSLILPRTFLTVSRLDCLRCF